MIYILALLKHQATPARLRVWAATRPGICSDEVRLLYAIDVAVRMAEAYPTLDADIQFAPELDDLCDTARVCAATLMPNAALPAEWERQVGVLVDAIETAAPWLGQDQWTIKHLQST